jgi:hypothetical protein
VRIDNTKLNLRIFMVIMKMLLGDHARMKDVIHPFQVVTLVGMLPSTPKDVDHCVTIRTSSNDIRKLCLFSYLRDRRGPWERPSGAPKSCCF